MNIQGKTGELRLTPTRAIILFQLLNEAAAEHTNTLRQRASLINMLRELEKQYPLVSPHTAGMI